MICILTRLFWGSNEIIFMKMFCKVGRFFYYIWPVDLGIFSLLRAEKLRVGADFVICLATVFTLALECS